MTAHIIIHAMVYILAAAVACPFLFIYFGRWRDLGKPVLKLPINKEERSRVVWMFFVLASQAVRLAFEAFSPRTVSYMPLILSVPLAIFVLLAGTGFREGGFATYFGRIYPWENILSYKVREGCLWLRFHDEGKYDGIYQSVVLGEETLAAAIALLQAHHIPEQTD